MPVSRVEVARACVMVYRLGLKPCGGNPPRYRDPDTGREYSERELAELWRQEVERPCQAGADTIR
jgi:hypothetical protein